MAWVYDWIFGPALHAGRIAAMRRVPPMPGDVVLEVGVGTGLTTPLYPAHCSVTGIDVSQPMLARAARRLATDRIHNVRLVQMDATELHFTDETFSVIYAAYVMSTVPDPVRVAREMNRVCRPGGHIVLLNHFHSAQPLAAACERLLSPVAARIGFCMDLALEPLLARAGLHAVSVERVNWPGLWSLVVCRKPQP
jgi:phosphatidylethanolamine/phosphatidyl-N-methylethanolamine N-methyltransferase